MKKIFSLLFGCLAAFIVSVSFSACGPKDQNIASAGDPLVGVWKWVYDYTSYTYTLTIKNDNTGTLVITTSNLSEEVSRAKFLWKYISENTVQIIIESGSIPGLGYAGNKIDLEYEFYGSDKLVITPAQDSYRSFGPFTRLSASSNAGQSGQPGNQPSQPGDQPGQPGNQPVQPGDQPSQPNDQPGSELAITEENIIGTWKLTSGKMDDITVPMSETWEFKADHTYVFNGSSSSSWALDGNQLQFGNERWPIISLTASSMVVEAIFKGQENMGHLLLFFERI